MAFACSVYDAPSTSSAAVEAGAGSGADVAGTGAASGADATGAHAGATNGGTAMTAGAAAGAGDTPGPGDAAGEPGIDPMSGGAAGAPAVMDDCPDDPDKLAPGACGCGVPDVPATTHADCGTLKSLLIHRYDFEGSGTAVKDRVGSAHGVVARGATLSKLNGEGVVLLGGGDVGAYVDLPNGLVSSLKNATFEAWVTWGGGSNWQRIFDFGDSTASVPENNQASGKTYLFVTPSSGSNVVQIGYSLASVSKELDVPGAAPLPQSLCQVVAVANDDGDELALYVNGSRVGATAWTGQLSQINDVNVWLGRSQYVADAELNAVYHEFRVYGAALTDAQVASTFHAGTDPQFFAY